MIVTDTGGTAELVTQGANGEIVPWDDVEALTTALQRLLNDAEQRRRMGDESRRRALAFGWPTLAARYLELCARVMVPSAESRAKDARSAKNVARDWTRELRG